MLIAMLFWKIILPSRGLRSTRSVEKEREKEDEKNSAMITLLLLFVAVVVAGGRLEAIWFGSVRCALVLLRITNSC